MPATLLPVGVGLPGLATHPWAYPALEALHIVGIALLLGSLVVLELRVWGLRPELSVQGLARLALGVTLAGFALAASSGLLMFASQPAELMAKQLPRRADRRWAIELAPLTRMQAWAVPEIRVGDRVALLGFTFPEERGEAVLRVEYLFLAGKVYGLRSSPACGSKHAPRREGLLATSAALLLPAWAAEPGAELELALKRGTPGVLVFHHALAPGNFDPTGFRLGDCTTQRNLDDKGRRQARQIVAWFTARGLKPTHVRSSPWCRCMDTARLAFGEPVEAWNALGSPRAGSEEV